MTASAPDGTITIYSRLFARVCAPERFAELSTGSASF